MRFPFYRILSDAKAIRTFYTDHYSHHRERDMSCLGAVFKGILGRCLATSHGRDEVKRCRGTRFTRSKMLIR